MSKRPIKKPNSKTCCRCGHDKLLSKFNRNGKLRSGAQRYSSNCSACQVEQNKEYRTKKRTARILAEAIKIMSETCADDPPTRCPSCSRACHHTVLRSFCGCGWRSS